MQERTWSTAGIAPSEQAQVWENLACEAWVPVRISPGEPDAGLVSSVAARRFGGLEVSRIVTGPQVVDRLNSHVASDPGSTFFINLPITAGSSATQDRRTASLRPGDFTILDSRREFELRFPRPLRQVSVAMPHDVLLPRLRDPDVVTARRVDGQTGVGAVLAGMLRTMATLPGPLDGEAASVLGEQASELLALALGSGTVRQRAQPRRLIMQLAFDEVERTLDDPTLSPERVAGQVGISVRYLHRLFAEEGTSFRRWVLSRRLARCHAELLDIRQRHRPIAEIGLRHGFVTGSHFARTYRAAYGLSPRQTRRLRGR